MTCFSQLLLGGGLIATGVVNILFGLSNFTLFCALWANEYCKALGHKLCKNIDFLVCCQGAWNVLGYVEYST